jgi:YbbR domain-containing protein
MLDALLANWPLKLLALALAFAIWVSVTGESRAVQDVEVPLEIQLPEDLVLASSPPTTVDVRLRGVESLIRRLDPVPMAVRVDLRDATTGEQEVLWSREDLKGIPRGVEIDFIDPDRTQLVIETRGRRQLPVEPTFLGQPPEGYAFYGAQVTPDQLRVEGVRLIDQDTLDVFVAVDAAAVERRLENVPVEVVGAPPGTSVEPTTLNVTLSGPPRLVDRLTADQIRLLADASAVTADSGTHEVPVRVEFAGVASDERSRINVEAISRRQVEVTLSGRRSL